MDNFDTKVTLHIGIHRHKVAWRLGYLVILLEHVTNKYCAQSGIVRMCLGI